MIMLLNFFYFTLYGMALIKFVQIIIIMIILFLVWTKFFVIYI